MITEVVSTQLLSRQTIQKSRGGQHIPVGGNGGAALGKAPQEQLGESLGREAPVVAPFLHGRPIDLTDSGDRGQEYSPRFQSPVERGDRRFYSVDLLQRLSANNTVVCVSRERPVNGKISYDRSFRISCSHMQYITSLYSFFPEAPRV